MTQLARPAHAAPSGDVSVTAACLRAALTLLGWPTSLLGWQPAPATQLTGPAPGAARPRGPHPTRLSAVPARARAPPIAALHAR